MKALKITDHPDSHEQILYFTSSSLSFNDEFLFFISDRSGHPNIFCRDLDIGTETQLTFNTDGTLKSYVYFNGSDYKGLGKASISTDPSSKKAYYIHGRDLCSVDISGIIRKIAILPDGQMTAFTHVSSDGKRICVPTVDARALESDRFVNEAPGYKLGTSGKNEVISDKPDYDIDERVRNENLSSYLRVYDTETGNEIACEKVERAWITHVQFCPSDPNLILYNHEWPSDCGIRRIWLWDGKSHRRLRNENSKRRKDDWTCHEMWQADGKYIIYHGKYNDGTAYIGRVSLSGDDNIEISLPKEYHRYGHFTAGCAHNNWLVSDGYYHPYGKSENSNWGGEWISLQIIDWNKETIKWIPLCEHHSMWNCQDSHPHPIFNHNDTEVFFTSNKDGSRAVFSVKIPT
jgi:oligogalacturonide lyase